MLEVTHAIVRPLFVIKEVQSFSGQTSKKPFVSTMNNSPQVSRDLLFSSRVSLFGQIDADWRPCQMVGCPGENQVWDRKRHQHIE